MNPTNHHITKACGKWSYYLCFLLAVLVTTTNWVHSWRLSNPLFSTRSITNQNIGYDKQHSWKSGSLLDKVTQYIIIFANGEIYIVIVIF